MNYFANILNKYREEANSKRNLGDRFEILMKGFLKTYPLYINKFSQIWLWKDFPYKTEFGAGQDIGIDLVAKISETEYCAIQCKFFSEDTPIDKTDVDSFITTSGRSFKDENNNELRFIERLWISTTNKWSKTAEDSIKNQDPQVNKLNLVDLENAEVDWELIEKGIYGEKARLKKKLPRKHQEKAIKNSHKHFTINSKDRGKLIMACGTGKTFTSLKIAEKETEDKSTLIIDNFNIHDDLDTIFKKSNLYKTTGGGLVLFLVPSIALIGQTLKEWAEQATNPINAICICSDAEVSKIKDEDGFEIEDLALPASTNTATIIRNFERIIKKQEKKLKENLQEELEKIKDSKKGKNAGAKADINNIAEENITGSITKKLQNEMTIVFSTYHSIETISKTQKELNTKYQDKDGNGKFIFDLIVCDEAHRTSGVVLKDEKGNNIESFFTKVHNNDFLQSKRRLYMTATPRLYNDDVKTKAKENEKIDILCSMDDETIYGEEIYRIGFGEAVEKGLLSDYKVIVLTIKEDEITQKMIEKIKKRNEEVKNIQDKITEDDLAKLIGCINAISKNTYYGENLKEIDPNPIKKAVAFTHSIKNSLHITSIFNEMTKIYYEFLDGQSKEKLSTVEGQHIDGHMGSALREERLKWLKEDIAKNNHCRILTNVKCLSEGVDVPSLDAILFLSAKNSQIDVVQSVGRVMRIAPNKKYGYIIIPIVIPYGENPEDYLDKSDKFKSVWTILNALRAHDDRFNAYVNTLEIDKRGKGNIDDKIIIDKTQESQDKDGKINVLLDNKPKLDQVIAEQLAFNFETYQNKVYATLVKKVGNKKYIEQWASDVGEIAKKNIARINDLIKTNTIEKEHFDEFMDGLHTNINPSISNEDAIEMLSQHLITKPIFEVLFKDYSFAKNNPMSQSMEKMIQLVEEKIPEEDSEKLKKFYDSVKLRIDGIKTAEGRQTIIYELYDKFFKTAFPKVVEKLGIVYTPVEVVDFIIHSVADVLKHEFDREISDENVNILDPFTGTGTFITRLLQSNLIKPQDLKRKYEKEIFANEIVLLAYYIASINIENIYHSIEDNIKTEQQIKLLEKEKIDRIYAEENNETYKKENLDIIKTKNMLYICLKENPIIDNQNFKINVPMSTFTMDIVDTKIKFVIEIRNTNISDIELDKTRREKIKYLKSLGFNVLELNTDDILDDVKEAVRKVYIALKSNKTTKEKDITEQEQENIIQQELEELNTQFEEYFSKINLASFKSDYTSFNGICLTDTFQLYEDVEQEKTIKSDTNLLKKVENAENFLKENTERIKNQKKSPITIIIGNPPYSATQKSANDDAQNQSYPKLDGKITDTYAKYSVATSKNKLYDSYIKAFRWATDRINERDGGVIGFITNSGWLDTGSADGFRKCLEEDFSKIYIVDLKGGIRGKNGELAKKEGQNVFDIMTGVAIVILVKKPNKGK